MANENTTFDPELVGFKRYKTPAGNYAYNVTYDENPVGLVGKSAQGFGNPWMGFLYGENGHITAGSGTDIKAVKSAIARAIGINFAILTGPPPKPAPKPEPKRPSRNPRLSRMQPRSHWVPEHSPRPLPLLASPCPRPKRGPSRNQRSKPS